VFHRLLIQTCHQLHSGEFHKFRPRQIRMVCDGAMVLNFVASAMMNGVCCMHSMEQDERRKQETRDVLRKVISVEYQRQRLMEQEQQERFLREQGLDAASVLADERRRLYIAAKLMASHNSISRGSHSERSEATHSRHYDDFVGQSILRDEGTSQMTLPPSPASRHNFGTPDLSQSENLDSRSRSAPASGVKRSSVRRIPLLVGSPSSTASVNSSLFDDNESDSEDDFDAIQLM
jgi:hypothetical protein